MDPIEKLFRKMENQDKMDYELFELDGTNHCPADGTISLKKFVDDDNALNFYSLVKKVNIIKKITKDDGKRAAAQFEILFQKRGRKPTKKPSRVS